MATDKARDIFDADAAAYRAYKYSPDVSLLDWHSFESRRVCAARLLPARAGTILDLGCGSGPYLPLLAERGERVVAMDFSAAMLAEAEKACPGLAVEYLQGDATAVPLAEASADIVNCIGVIEYLPQPERCLAEAFRVLRPGGFLVVSVPNARSLWRLTERCYGPVLRRLRRLFRRRRPAQKMDSFPRRLFTESAIQSMLEATGFVVERVGYYNCRVPFVGAISARASVGLSRWLERRAPRWAATWLAGGLVVRAGERQVFASSPEGPACPRPGAPG